MIYTVSLSFAFVLISMMFVYLLFAVYKWYECRDNNNFKNIKYTKQLFDSIRETNAARTFIVKYLFQRITFCLIAALWMPSNTYPKLGIYSLLQLVFFVYTVVLRPFNNVKDNLLEIMNELHYVILTCSLLFLNYEYNWNQTLEIIYIAVIFSNNITVFLIALIFLFKLLFSCIIKGKNKLLTFRNIKEITSKFKEYNYSKNRST